jgi:hypothetical protein
MGDLQAQLEDLRRLWDEERQAKERALLELDVIRAGGSGSVGGPPNAHMTHPNVSMSMPNAHPNPYDHRTGQEVDAHDRAYHPSDRHHHAQRGSDGNGPGGHIPDIQDAQMQSDAEGDMVDLAVPRDPDVASGQLALRDPDVAGEGDASGSVDPEADAEGEEGDEDDERPGKRRHV